MKIEIGISTFGETTPLRKTGRPISHAERLQNLVEEIELADKVGLDVYAIGEHHREDFAVSAPEIVLAAGAAKTKNIRLSSAVTILSSLDPIRVYQQYATIDALSNGRAEIMTGRGSFTESFPLFGYDLKDYDALFDEKMEMLLKINEQTKLTWQGKYTQNVDNLPVYPRAVQPKLPLEVATGGNIESTIKVAEWGLPIVYAIIGGDPKNFAPLIKLYREVWDKLGHDKAKQKVSAHSWGWLAEDQTKAERDYFYPTKVLIDTISQERPHWEPLTFNAYQTMIGENGAMFVGDPETVATKLIKVIETLGLDRFMLHLPVGSMQHEETLKAIELFGKEVAPKVRAHFAKK